MEHDGSMAVRPTVRAMLLWYWVPLVAYAGLIFYLSSQTRPAAATLWLLIHIGDKPLHAIEYGILGILCYRAFRYAAGERAARSALLLAAVTATGYGVTDEIHQAFVPRRYPDGWDLLADAIGATAAASIRHWLPIADREPAAMPVAGSSE